MSIFYYNSITYMPLIIGLLIITGDTLLKFDPKLISLINKSVIEKQLFTTKITLIILFGLFLFQIIFIEIFNENYLYNYFENNI